jgi:hypothetical protein
MSAENAFVLSTSAVENAVSEPISSVGSSRPQSTKVEDMRIMESTAFGFVALVAQILVVATVTI